MARPANKFAQITNQQQRDELHDLWRNHPNHYTRVRAHAVLLSDQHYPISKLCDIFGVDRDSVSSWIDRFNEGGPTALTDEDRPGRPPSLDDHEQQLLRELIGKFPNHPARVLAEFQRQTGKQLSRELLRQYAKRFRLSWKRFRPSLRGKRNEQAFRQAKEELAELLEEPNLDVVYMDEAGFSVKGVVPYGWTPIGERAEIQLSGRQGSVVQAIGLQRQDGDTMTYLHEGTVNTEIVVQVLNDYSTQLDRPTVIILDNASCHRSAAFYAQLDAWAERGLYVYHIPPYSPELNAIEGFWKRLKYNLLPPTAYEKCARLVGTLASTLSEIGQAVFLPSLFRYAE